MNAASIILEIPVDLLLSVLCLNVCLDVNLSYL